MANTLTGLIPLIEDTADVVSREIVGMVPAVFLNGKAEQVAKDQDVTYPVVPAAESSDIVPAATPPALVDTNYGTGTMKITKSKHHTFHWTGEDEASISNNMQNILQNNKFAQAFRVLVNEMEADLAALYVSASRAYGTAGTTPFATAGDFTDAAEVVRILKDNGAPTGDLQLVINTAAGAKIIGKQSRADIIGEGNVASLQQQGILLAIAGCNIRESAQVKAHTKGTGTGYLVNDATPLAIGDTVIAADTGSNTIIAGDVTTFAADTANNYIVASALSGGSFSINDPGLRLSIPNDNAITVGNSYAANMAFDRSAIHLLARLPKVPKKDLAVDEFIMVDPVSGIPFRIALYEGYHANQIEVSVAWGVKPVKPEHIALLLG